MHALTHSCHRVRLQRRSCLGRLSRQPVSTTLIISWRARGNTVGFGGLAKGSATVGRIGYEGRNDYTAIGSVVNLASWICAAAEDGQILIDAAVAAELGEAFALAPLGTRPLRGFAEAVPVFAVQPRDVDLATLPAAK